MFYHIGVLLKKYNNYVLAQKKIIICSGLLAAFIGMQYTDLDLWAGWMTCWPLNVTIATLLILSIYICVERIKNWRYFTDFLAEIGRLSLLVLIIHTIEYSFDIAGKILSCQIILNENTYLYRVCLIFAKLSFCIVGMYLLRNNKVLRAVLNIR